MKKILLLALTLSCFVAYGQKKKTEKVEEPKKAYTFTDVKINPQTPVQNQASSGTCWSFSGIGFVESELLRLGKGEHKLSEMWIVRHTYLEKAKKYARMHGTINLAGGGATHDVFNMIDKYGVVPQEVYGGLNYGTEKHVHGELDNVVKAYMDAIIRNPNRGLSTGWEAGLNGILDAYLGVVPEKFTYKGKEYTPKSYAQELGINGDDYVSLTSFTHHPFDTYFAVEVPDNWAWKESLNVPLDKFMATIDKALQSGVSVLWASDVSEKGFKYNLGFAVLPEAKLDNMNDSEKAKWSALTPAEMSKAIFEFKEPVTETVVNQQLRQEWFDNYATTDDHGMVIVGIAKDQNGNKFYKVKNSWATDNEYKGYFYVSPAFVAGKTLNIMIPKSSL